MGSTLDQINFAKRGPLAKLNISCVQAGSASAQAQQRMTDNQSLHLSTAYWDKRNFWPLDVRHSCRQAGQRRSGCTREAELPPNYRLNNPNVVGSVYNASTSSLEAAGGGVTLLETSVSRERPSRPGSTSAQRRLARSCPEAAPRCPWPSPSWAWKHKH